MSLLRLDRISSGAECSCSPHSRNFKPCSREGQPQSTALIRRPSVVVSAQKRAVGSAATFDVAQTLLSPKSELLDRQLFESKFTATQTTKISSLQTLERLKDDLQSALQDLEEQSFAHDFSVSDWDKLNAARREHLLEELHRQQAEVLQKEKRRRQRASKRLARRNASTVASSVSTEPQPEDAVAASVGLLHTGHTDPSARRSKVKGAGRLRGARAAAVSRTQAHAHWGKPSVLDASNNNSVAKRPVKEFVATGSSTVADYMKNMPQHSLLTVSEEAELSGKVKDWLKLSRRREELAQTLGRQPLIAEWAASFDQPVEEFSHRLEAGTKARARMLTCNQRLVISIARRYRNRGMELADLVQEGMVGLVRSVEKFDHTKGFKFSTYATWWVRQSITRALADLAKVIRLPVHLHEILIKINKEERDYYAIHKNWPSVEQVARALDLPAEKIRMIKQAAADPKALEDPIKKGDPESATLAEVVEDTTESESSVQLMHASMAQDMDCLLHTLSRREHGILRMRYGLDDGQPKTLEEIGILFRVTRERIRQIEVKALAKLKEPNRHSSLKLYSSGEAMAFTTEAGWKQSAHRSEL